MGVGGRQARVTTSAGATDCYSRAAIAGDGSAAPSFVGRVAPAFGPSSFQNNACGCVSVRSALEVSFQSSGSVVANRGCCLLPPWSEHQASSLQPVVAGQGRGGVWGKRAGPTNNCRPPSPTIQTDNARRRKGGTCPFPPPPPNPLPPNGRRLNTLLTRLRSLRALSLLRDRARRCSRSTRRARIPKGPEPPLPPDAHAIALASQSASLWMWVGGRSWCSFEGLASKGRSRRKTWRGPSSRSSLALRRGRLQEQQAASPGAPSVKVGTHGHTRKNFGWGVTVVKGVW